MTPDSTAATEQWDTFSSKASCYYCLARGHWSHMQCRTTEPHGPHVWDSSVVIYGPYHCGGVR